jgi:hypothetical protein
MERTYLLFDWLTGNYLLLNQKGAALCHAVAEAYQGVSCYTQLMT